MRFLKLPTIPPSPLAMAYALMCLLLPTVSLFNARALVPVIVTIALAALIIAWRKQMLGVWRSIDRPLGYLVIGYILAALLASFSAGTLGLSITTVVKLLGIAVIAAILLPLQSKLSAPDRRWVFLALLLSVTATLVWIFTDILSGARISAAIFDLDADNPDTHYRLSLYGYFWYKSASTLLVILALVLGIYLQKNNKPVFAIVLALAAGLIAYVIGSRTASYGLLAAMSIGMIYHLLGRFRVKVSIALLAISFLVPIWAPSISFAPKDISAELSKKYSFAYSMVYRMYIWEYVTGKVHERPLHGWGAGASKRLGTEEMGVMVDPTFGKLGEAIPVHPHNSILQIWLEYGLLGALMAFTLLCRALVLAERSLRKPGVRIWAASTAGLFACFFGFNFSISSSWWLASVVACIALAMTFAGQPGAHADEPEEL